MIPETILSESELITRVSNKSVKDFELLYDTYAASLYSVTLTIIPDPKIAAQALEASFSEMWRNLKNFDAGKMRLFTWMYQITRSTALRYQLIFASQPATDAERCTNSVDTSSAILHEISKPIFLRATPNGHKTLCF